MNCLGKGVRGRGTTSFRSPVLCGSALALSFALLSGCTGSPTYGTGTPADQQLLQDLSSAMTLSRKKKEAVAYAPRPDLVMPPSTEVLPPPQQDLATADNPDWPESPEQRLARIRAEATANQDDPNYRADVVRDVATSPSKQVSERSRWNDLPDQTQADTKREQFNERLAATQQGDPKVRRYLSEPPLDLRKPADTAPVNDVGEDEWKKEREARRKAQPARSRGLIPGL